MNTENSNKPTRDTDSAIKHLRKRCNDLGSMVKHLEKELRQTAREHSDMTHTLRLELIKANREEFDKFYNTLVNLGTIAKLQENEREISKYQLLEQLRNGSLSRSAYLLTIKRQKESIKEANNKYYSFYSQGIKTLFPNDYELFTPVILKEIVNKLDS